MDLPSPNHILFAISIARNTIGKSILLDVSTGELCVVRNSGNGVAPCFPGAEGPGDGLVRWLEGYASDLAGGVLKVGELIPTQPASLGVSRFPHAGPRYSCCVTRGAPLPPHFTPQPAHACGRTPYRPMTRARGQSQRKRPYRRRVVPQA